MLVEPNRLRRLNQMHRYLVELSKSARDDQAPMLAYLIEMAALQAVEEKKSEQRKHK